ncbi:tachylectin-related carbohydrate-binding protein [Streptomyces sp.]|uniref:aggregation-promoting factor C-terminal-like domain-containing protein n=1 Tax=Streptomyces sp. TaxID=1931 RepID=UPI002D3C1B3E|nr:tachylectin-related carbohydrate-binding protein [Streptomyces sp.]HZF87230.1 tachylectin-related carbohydrate-binding protein [Streptomyces sp.]
MKNVRRTGRGVAGLLTAGALGAGLLTVATTTAAEAATTCRGGVNIYGVLDDGRLTFSAINPATGDLAKVLVGPGLGFEPKAVATLNFNTVLVTSTTGALYRVDVRTNNTSLALMTAPVKIADSGWTHDKLTYDGHGHLYGTTAAGLLLRYNVTEDKPAGSQHIGARTEIGTGFVLKTLTATGDDRLSATTDDGRLLDYTVSGAGAWKSNLLKADGWSGFNQLVSPGGGLYYGRLATGAMYWYKDANPTDGSGADISYHLDDPVNTSGWTQKMLSAQPGTYTCTTSVTTVNRDNIAEVKAAGRQLMNEKDAAWATSAQWSCLENLWDHESNWRWNATNPSSGAYGIPQSLPASKMDSAGDDWKTNPLTQIRWGLNYIDGRYGSPCNAWNFWQANNWY